MTSIQLSQPHNKLNIDEICCTNKDWWFDGHADKTSRSPNLAMQLCKCACESVLICGIMWKRFVWFLLAYENIWNFHKLSNLPWPGGIGLKFINTQCLARVDQGPQILPAHTLYCPPGACAGSALPVWFTIFEWSVLSVLYIFIAVLSEYAHHIAQPRLWSKLSSHALPGLWPVPSFILLSPSLLISIQCSSNTSLWRSASTSSHLAELQSLAFWILDLLLWLMLCSSWRFLLSAQFFGALSLLVLHCSHRASSCCCCSTYSI